MATSCAVATIFASAPGSNGLVPSAQNSLRLVLLCPGLRMATMHRLTFHSPPISLTAAVMTASALFCRYSLRVISDTRVKLLTSAASVAWAADAVAAGATLFGAAVGGGALEVFGFNPADKYSRCKSWFFSSS